MNNEVELAKKIITEEIEREGLRIEKILLFGSRARGDYTRDSDWDFYVIIDRDIPFNKRRRIITCIKRRLAKSKIPNDIIIQSASAGERRKNDTGYLSYYVLKEGIELI